MDDPDNQRLLDQIGWHHAGGNLLPFLDQPEVARVLGMSQRTIYTGIGELELEAMGNDDPPHSVPVAVLSASAILAVVVAKSPNANQGWRKKGVDYR